MRQTIWTREKIIQVMETPLLDLVFKASVVHREHHDPGRIQMSSLLSIKTGGCPEDCSYCPQSARYKTNVKRKGMLGLAKVVAHAKQAKDAGVSRICLGAAWRQVKDGKDFDMVIKMVKSIKAMNLEVCCTLGMLSEQQAERLAEAGLYAYNHNIDTSPEYYEKVIRTRDFQDRINTLKRVRKAGMTVCSGGIIGMGESPSDRAAMLEILVKLNPPPESVPINALVPVKGTPFGERKSICSFDLVRMIATTRLILPTSKVRLSAGRTELSESEQALCFLAGANSLFIGDKLLTTPNPSMDDDMRMMQKFGLTPVRAYEVRNKNR